MHIDLPIPSFILLLTAVAIICAAIGAACAAPLAHRRTIELKRDLQAWQFIVDEYRCWLGPEMPDVARLLDNLEADAAGAPLNSGTPSFADNCTVNGLREQLRRIRTGLQLRGEATTHPADTTDISRVSAPSISPAGNGSIQAR